MSTNYPGALDNFTNPTATDSLNSVTVPHADQHANANDAIEAIEATLGLNPQGGSVSVVARLNTLDSTVSGKVASVGSGSTAITIGGTATAPTVAVASASTSVAGVVQLTDSTSSTSTTTAATPASVKTVNDSLTSHTSATTAHGSTSSNTASAIVQRDASGNFTAGVITATLNGNATTATSATTATNVTGTVAIANGGTNATDAATARTNLAVPGLTTANTFTTGTQIIQAGANATVPLRIKRNGPSQTADLLQVNTSDDVTTLAKIDKDGKITAADFIDSSMTTAGVVTNTSGGLFQTSTTLSPSLGGTGSTYGALMVGHCQLNATVTKNANDTTAEAIFRTGTANNTIQYFNVDADTVYFFEGFIQFAKTSTSSVLNTSLLYVATGSTSALTEQAARLNVQYFGTTAMIGVGSVNASATTAASPATTLTVSYCLFRGFIRTHATTAGRINIAQWLDTAGASAPTWSAGSYINLYKVGTGNQQTFGNWTA